MRKETGSGDLELQAVISTQNIGLVRDFEPKYEVWDWLRGYQISSRDFDPKYRFGPRFRTEIWGVRLAAGVSDFNPRFHSRHLFFGHILPDIFTSRLRERHEGQKVASQLIFNRNTARFRPRFRFSEIAARNSFGNPSSFFTVKSHLKIQPAF
jgi:hypothetical protein